jgi:hypothetical protein
MKYDLVIPCHEKDFVKLKYCIQSCILFLNPEPEKIYVVSQRPFTHNIENIVHVYDHHAIRTNINSIDYHRKNWIYQQFIKLGQDFTKNDMYLCVDSDLFFNKPIELFDGDKPKFFISDREQNHQPYFNFMKKSHGLDKQVDHTFINKNLSDDCLLSEFELYGNFVTKHHPEKYIKQNTKTKMFGRYANQPWSEQEIENHASQMKDKDYDLFTIHSWT